MAYPDKQNITVNFSKGLDKKTDPFQVELGKFLQLQNSVFNKGGLLQKRNGFGKLPSLPDTSNTYATTFNGNLTAIGDTLNAYSAGSASWVDKGSIQPVELTTLPLVRSTTNQSYASTAIAPNGLVCTVYTDNVPVAGVNTLKYKYAIADSVTGQNIVAPTLITSTGVVTYAPKVFLLGVYFVIVFDAVISASNHLQYIAINSNIPTAVTAAADISTQYTAASTGTFSGIVFNNNLYLAWNGNDGGGAIRMTYIDQTLTQHNTVVIAGQVCTQISVTVDATDRNTPVIWVSYHDTGTTDGHVLARNQQLDEILAPTLSFTGTVVNNVTCVASGGIVTSIYQAYAVYGYASSVRTDYLYYTQINLSGTVLVSSIMRLSVGLASHAFFLNGNTYVLAVYQSVNQSTYFLLSVPDGKVVAKLAYSNGGNYYTTGLPSVTVNDTSVSISYLIKDLVAATNKSQSAASASAVYSQTGVNLATFDITSDNVVASEIGGNLNISGGFLWGYDGYQATEQGFHLYPDTVVATTNGAGGLIAAQQYFYVATYEWADNQGNVFRSAPSIPYSITTTGATSTNTINVPNLRLTYKTNVKIVLYRWSTAQQTYYQVTSLTLPTLNDPNTDSVAITDTLADSAIVGNNILYTTGGVIENIAAPATKIIALWQSRLFLVDSEDRNLLWFSKQVIEATPVEMSDLFTIYVPPTTAAQVSTGGMTALSAMDDKLIIFKENAIYYIAGQGPDNTGANNQFSDPVFITSTVGCAQPKSIAFIPQGLMFQSNKGIWLLGRDLQTSYIGAAVETDTATATVQSAVNVPGTNQVRFTLDSGVTLMYDYYYGEWGTFTNVPAVSSTIYQDLHTYINSSGAVYQETPGKYLDGSKPVLISFKTGWINLAGLQGFQRAYEFYLLATYVTPHKLQMQIAYDYAPSPSQTVIITPDNYSAPYGTGQAVSIYGNGSPYGGPAALEQWRVFLKQQKCQSFQITLNEAFDPSYGTIAGAGFTMSGIDLTVGIKKGRPSLRASRQTG